MKIPEMKVVHTNKQDKTFEEDNYVYCECGHQLYTTLKGKYAGCYMCPIHGHTKFKTKHKFTLQQKKIISANCIGKQRVKDAVDYLNEILDGE